MVKNQFSKNCVIYTSEGEVLQLEYAKKGALKGKMILSFSSANHLIIFIINHKFKTSRTSLNKIDILSQNFSVVRSGNIGDSIYLSGFVKKNSLEYYNLNKRNCPMNKISYKCSSLFASKIFSMENRPFGSNLLLTSFDLMGPSIKKIYNDSRSFDYKVFIHSSKYDKLNDYFFKNITKIEFFSQDELIFWCLKIYLKLMILEISSRFLYKYFQLAITGKKTPFVVINNKVKYYLINDLPFLKKKIVTAFLQLEKKIDFRKHF
jgi:20S proteasome alpha/beta subunit